MARNPKGAGSQVASYDGTKLTRHDFPPDFIFGAATASYQVEGAYLGGSKGLSNWDTFSVRKPGKISDGSNGSVAIDHCNRFEEDVKLMKKIGLDTYRFSISWSRILPGGRLSAGINREGVKFYNDLIDLLLAEGITPMVTIFHFDIPQTLEDEYTGFLDRRIVVDFAEYAEVCFFEFGDRVKLWITLNEPLSYTTNGFVTGTFPPSHGNAQEDDGVAYRCARVSDDTCLPGDPSTEPYLVAHHLLLAHAKAVHIYRTKYQSVQGGTIGIANVSSWFDPYDSSSLEDVAAAERAVDFNWGWFTAPLVKGQYPGVMRERVGQRLPEFTPEEQQLIRGSYDFIGMNYYTTNLAQNYPPSSPQQITYSTDMGVKLHTAYPDGTPVGPRAASEWLYIVPYGIHKLLMHNKEAYNNPLVYITENGVSEKNDPKTPIPLALRDDYRIDYYQQHLAYLKNAIEDGVDVKGFVMWALFDNYEWTAGYTVRFGIYYVDYLNNLNRYPKNSAIWYMNFLNRNAPKRQVAQVAFQADTAAVKRKRNR